jgi:hypothetical protein
MRCENFVSLAFFAPIAVSFSEASAQSNLKLSENAFVKSFEAKGKGCKTESVTHSSLNGIETFEFSTLRLPQNANSEFEKTSCVLFLNWESKKSVVIENPILEVEFEDKPEAEQKNISETHLLLRWSEKGKPMQVESIQIKSDSSEKNSGSRFFWNPNSKIEILVPENKTREFKTIVALEILQFPATQPVKIQSLKFESKVNK